MTEASSDRWCILRTAGQRTLPLATSLAAVGFDVWTPRRTFIRVRPGKHTKTPVKREITVAILPTFVFARSADVRALSSIAVDPASTHPPFSIFRHAGRIAHVRDTDVTGLKDAERAADEAMQAEREAEDREAKRRARAAMLRTEQARRRALRSERHLIDPGTQVRVKDAAWLSGATGVVETGDGRSFLVAFGGSFRMEIEAWQLLPIDVDALATSAA